MTKVLILGANGQIAREAIDLFKDRKDIQLSLFLRQAKRIQPVAPSDSKIIEGDVLNPEDLTAAVTGQDVVYANLSGTNSIEKQAKSVVTAMDKAGVKRLIWISTLGIYDEVPGKFGEWNHHMLDDGYLPNYSAAAKIIEASDLDYTIIRPAWLTNKHEIDYETTQKGTPFVGTEVSRRSVAAFVVELAENPAIEIRHSVGLNKPNTDGDQPAWY
ncbi:SDR family oxidoreductase [Agrilactobacillus yilanensis]|uniref:SDR family oxidoreductase n=1 Tax=Agrilactobacillus yilanensis TaxID=2485997 RepID=A0ABW4J516_9LACO|nr:SDR family oxidoreductase [Agrilactobacillus yilanensis]